MSDKQIFALVVIVAVYLWWHKKNQTAYSRQFNGPGMTSGNGKVSTAPRSRRQLPASSSPWRGGADNLIAAPVVRGQALGMGQRYLGARSMAGRLRSSSSSGFGTGPIAPSFPTSQVTSTRNISLGNGRIQVPSWAAIPRTVRGPGGQGSILNLG